MMIGEEATFNGVLVPHERYLYKESELKACRYMVDHPPECPDSDHKTSLITVGLVSISVGFIAGLLSGR